MVLMWPKKHFLGHALGILMMMIDDYHDDGGDDHDDGGYKPEQVEVVLSLKTALYGTVIATYTVASKIAYSIMIREMRMRSMRVKMRMIIMIMGETETDQVPEVFEVAIVG